MESKAYGKKIGKDLRISHICPVQHGGQKHWKAMQESIPDRHVPPFRQGERSHRLYPIDTKGKWFMLT